ncbi:MAG: tetratricopeptide repeat protein [Sulfurovum sp.]|uniref:tetratricopeptide repeat protein n=1 Tax=Sulfurovum sp. TaxID=1969726 RepID=UPI002867F815|nr:tetratricopeptide repeat protein [Sulfurovum sp.]MCO4845669.1 tetratricopeptide repeat protein [Sulfurovum sp.]
MTTFQLLLLIVAGGVFYLFFKQLFSGNHPKRGVDFEAKVADEQIGGINRPDKTFSTPSVQPTRMEQLLKMTDDAVEKKDFEEAKKALGSALIIEENNTKVLQKMGYVCMQTGEFEEAKESYEKLLSLDDTDDMAHALLANVLHKLSDEEGAEKHHERALLLDPEYAPHHFNYANTLYELGRKKEALVGYTKAYELDDTLEEAKKMMKELGSDNE